MAADVENSRGFIIPQDTAEAGGEAGQRVDWSANGSEHRQTQERSPAIKKHGERSCKTLYVS